MDQEQLAEIVKDIEEEKALGKVSAVQVFRSLLNQPDLVSLSSANATDVGSADGYFKFNVNMPRPILEAETLQLLNANIPLATQNIPDTACAFWYYRLSLYSGKLPNVNNLYWVRLLPSYYRPEFITEPTTFGFNRTFDGYADVAAQLKLASAGDLAQENYSHINWDVTVPPYYRIQFIKDEAKITYNSAINKFQFAGNQGLALSVRDPQLIFTEWNAITAYLLYDKVKSPTYVQGEGYIVYYALQANTNQALPTYPEEYNAYWSRAYGYEGVAEWSQYTAYLVGRYVAYNDLLWICIQNSFANTPAALSAYWEVVLTNPEFPPVYQFLTAGYNDPNVAIMQGEGQRQWSPYALFEEGDNVFYNGVVYKSLWQNLGTEPFPVPNTTDNAYSATRLYAVGEYVYSGGKYYICVLATKGNAPTGAYTNNTWWNFIEYDPNRPTGSTPPASRYYQVGDLVTYVGYSYVPFWKCIKANPPAGSLNAGVDSRFGLNQYWAPCYWTTGTSATLVPYTGLASISAGLDMMDDYAGVTHYPYPQGIPPQPFSPEPHRLLNSILGFTWNGVFTPTMLNVIYDAVTLSGSSSVTQLLNRVRPLPIYVQPALQAGLSYDPDSIQDSFTYTANGYANLVYTNVVNIYATIVAGSTLDTQRNTNLIATASANAGNLGIGFAANFINTPLRVNMADIYSIGIELRDEAGDPYVLTNNAISSFTLKITYKERPLENKE